MTLPKESALDARFALAKELAREAGARALAYFNARDELIVETKNNPQDVVSVADREVEKLVRERIGQAFPNDGVLGEEYGLAPGTTGFTWAVDPIDGTSSFLAGIPSWCVSIGAFYEGEIVVGVVCAPCGDELYAAAHGRGATLNGRRLALDESQTVANGLTGIGANHHVSPQAVGAIIERLLQAKGNFIRNGSGALMLAYVAAGRLVGYFEPYMHAWDCLAGYCLVREAGGVFHPFPLAGEALTKGAPVLAAGPGAVEDLKRIAGM